MTTNSRLLTAGAATLSQQWARDPFSPRRSNPPLPGEMSAKPEFPRRSPCSRWSGEQVRTSTPQPSGGIKRSWRGARTALSACRLLPHVLLLLCTPGGRLVQADLVVWTRIMKEPPPDTLPDLLRAFLLFMTFTKEFRNLFYLRCGTVARIFAPLCPSLSGLDIQCPSIGPGLFIQHGDNTFVTARRIGANCWIGRHVVIGYSNDTDVPSLGDNVRIFSGAKIIGNVEVGDDATVGLNTVVMSNVAPGTTVLGVPGRVVWSTGGQRGPNVQSETS